MTLAAQHFKSLLGDFSRKIISSSADFRDQIMAVQLSQEYDIASSCQEKSCRSIISHELLSNKDGVRYETFQQQQQ